MILQMTPIQYVVSIIAIVLGVYSLFRFKQAVGIFVFLCVLAGGSYYLSTGKNPAYFIQNQHRGASRNVNATARGFDTGKARLESLPFDPEVIRRASGGLEAAYGRFRIQTDRGCEELELYGLQSEEPSKSGKGSADEIIKALEDIRGIAEKGGS